MSPCCIYGCMSSTPVTKDKTTGSFYCAKHSAKQTPTVASSPQPRLKDK